MPVNCTQCGVQLEPGSRFCVNCGAPVPNAPLPRENKPNLDLSAYFDDPRDADPMQPVSLPQRQSQPVRAPRPQGQGQAARAPQRQGQSAKGSRPQNQRGKAAPAPEKSDRGLNIALLICGMLLIAVIVFMLFLWLWPRSTNTPAQPTAPQIPQVTPEAQIPSEPSPDPLTPAVITPSPAPANTDTPIVIVTPSAQPSAAPVTPVVPSTPSPTPGAVAIVTPPPTPGPDYLLPNSDSHYLTVDDIKGLSHEELCFARNEIFARHGRIFKTPQLAAYFNSKSWYHGTISPDKFDESVLNKYEWANVNLIREYENKYYGGSYY